MSDAGGQQPDDRQRPLEYRSGVDEARDRPWPHGFQVLLGAMTSVIVIAFGVFFSFAINDKVAPIIVLVLLSIGLGALGAHAHTDPRRRGYAFGLWLGIGLMLLCEGVCFSAM